jgi:hypothetical protein
VFCHIVAEAETTMQEVTLWFLAALSVVLIVTSRVDGQEVILLQDPYISPVGQVRESLRFVGFYSNDLEVLLAGND